MAADLAKLVDLAYSAAVDDGLWRSWTEELVEQLHSPGALFYVIDPDHFDMCQSHMCFRERDNDYISREYRAGPVNDDPQMHRVCAVKRSEIYLDIDHVNVEDPDSGISPLAGSDNRHASSHNGFRGASGWA